jgi:hypothetical protein
VIQGDGNRTSLSLGAGWYHAIIDYTNGLASGNPVTATNEINGAFTGDTIGGTVGLTEKVALGGSFGLNLSVQGRYARFAQVTASNLTNAAGQLQETGPYSLAIVTLNGYSILEPANRGVIDIAQSQGQARYAVVDYSGFDGELSFEFYF